MDGERPEEGDAADTAGDDEPTPEADGGEGLKAHTVRLELVDEPGELLSALQPIAEQGGNLLSIYHERGSLTPRGHVPVEIDLECPPGRIDDIVDALQQAGVRVIQQDAERYDEQATVLLVGDLVETDLSDSLSRIEAAGDVSVVDFSVAAPEGTAAVASARLRLAAASGAVADALAVVRDVAAEKDLRIVEPLGGDR